METALTTALFLAAVATNATRADALNADRANIQAALIRDRAASRAEAGVVAGAQSNDSTAVVASDRLNQRDADIDRQRSQGSLPIGTQLVTSTGKLSTIRDINAVQSGSVADWAFVYRMADGTLTMSRFSERPSTTDAVALTNVLTQLPSDATVTTINDSNGRPLPGTMLLLPAYPHRHENDFDRAHGNDRH